MPYFDFPKLTKIAHDILIIKHEINETLTLWVENWLGKPLLKDNYQYFFFINMGIFIEYNSTSIWLTLSTSL